MARFVDQTFLSLKSPPSHEVGAQLLVTVAAMAESEVDTPLEDAAAVAAGVDALLRDYDDYYQLWRLERDGVISHDLVLSPDEGGLLFVAGSTQRAAMLAWETWECADAALAAEVEQAFTEVLASERARMEAMLAQTRPAAPTRPSVAGEASSGFSFVALPELRERGGLDQVDQRRAALFWRFEGGAARDLDSFDAWLGAGELNRYEVRDAEGHAHAVWWGLDDHGLLFRAGSAELIGEAIQHGFVCRDLPLWRGIAAAAGQPGLVSWAVGEDVGAAGDRVWINPPEAEPVWQELFGTGA